MEILNETLQRIYDKFIHFIVCDDFSTQEGIATKLYFYDAITLRDYIRNNSKVSISVIIKDDENSIPKGAYLNPNEVEDLAHHQHLCEMY